MEIEPMEMVELDLDIKGNVKPPKHDHRIIMDADTVVYASCAVCEFEAYDAEKDEMVYDINIQDAVEHAKGKIELILDLIGGKWENLEVHFTGGKNSFRYDLLTEAFPDSEHMHYKAKRQLKRTPVGLTALKKELLKIIEGAMHYEFEADDVVVMLKKKYGADAILCAVDKDVLGNTPGTHWNYYDSQKYGIEMKWVDISEDEANFNQYMQAITGDKSDNVPGIPGIGPKKAANFIELGMTEEELWGGVLQAYLKHCKYGDPLDMAILNMRLVSMHQLNENMEVVLWNPPE
jgi:hypothetical protein